MHKKIVMDVSFLFFSIQKYNFQLFYLALSFKTQKKQCVTTSELIRYNIPLILRVGHIIYYDDVNI